MPRDPKTGRFTPARRANNAWGRAVSFWPTVIAVLVELTVLGWLAVLWPPLPDVEADPLVKILGASIGSILGVCSGILRPEKHQLKDPSAYFPFLPFAVLAILITTGTQLFGTAGEPKFIAKRCEDTVRHTYTDGPVEPAIQCLETVFSLNAGYLIDGQPVREKLADSLVNAAVQNIREWVRHRTEWAKMTTAETYLQRARQLVPNHPQLFFELEKLRLYLDANSNWERSWPEAARNLHALYCLTKVQQNPNESDYDLNNVGSALWVALDNWAASLEGPRGDALRDRAQSIVADNYDCHSVPDTTNRNP